MILSAIYGLTNLINIISRLSFLFVDFSDSEFSARRIAYKHIRFNVFCVAVRETATVLRRWHQACRAYCRVYSR